MAKLLFRINETTRGIFDNGEFPKRLPRVQKQTERSGMTSRYRVILQIECDDEIVLRQMGVEYLEQIKEDALDGDYLASYIEHELGWAEQSFYRIELEEITLLESIPNTDSDVVPGEEQESLK